MPDLSTLSRINAHAVLRAEGLFTVEGIAEVHGHQRAWFQDSESNTLVLMQR
jgi:hypothetical protein